jgi:hypothetical protein
MNHRPFGAFRTDTRTNPGSAEKLGKTIIDHIEILR